jgi:hypothetical protein
MKWEPYSMRKIRLQHLAPRPHFALCWVPAFSQRPLIKTNANLRAMRKLYATLVRQILNSSTVRSESSPVASRELKKWCKRNKDRWYIPEWLLKRWGMSVDPNVTS